MNNYNLQTLPGKPIAVLPFVNMSADPDNEYFSDGITEEIINVLTKIQGLKVIARTSSFAFKGKNVDVRTIGNLLGVTTILEGSVRKSKNRIRITAQLINTYSRDKEGWAKHKIVDKRFLSGASWQNQCFSPDSCTVFLGQCPKRDKTINSKEPGPRR